MSFWKSSLSLLMVSGRCFTLVMSPSAGVFKKYTMYTVSMFTVSNLNEVNQLSTATAYSAQGGEFAKLYLYILKLWADIFSFVSLHVSFFLLVYFSPSVPSSVPSFKVFFLGSTDVTLHWEPVPKPKQHGVILHYQIGIEGTEKGTKNQNTTQLYNIVS